jgi:hypothetical protein
VCESAGSPSDVVLVALVTFSLDSLPESVSTDVYHIYINYIYTHTANFQRDRLDPHKYVSMCLRTRSPIDPYRYVSPPNAMGALEKSHQIVFDLVTHVFAE